MTNVVTRYDCVCDPEPHTIIGDNCMVEAAAGEYVRWEDYERLRAELDQRNAEFREYARETELEFRKLRGSPEPCEQRAQPLEAETRAATSRKVPSTEDAGRPLPPEVLADALQDVVHTDPGPVRAAHAVKSTAQPSYWETFRDNFAKRLAEYKLPTGLPEQPVAAHRITFAWPVSDVPYNFELIREDYQKLTGVCPLPGPPKKSGDPPRITERDYTDAAMHAGLPPPTERDIKAMNAVIDALYANRKKSGE